VDGSMKIRKNYTLYVNPMLGSACYGNMKFNRRIINASIGEIYICTFSELKKNLLILQERGYSIWKRNW